MTKATKFPSLLCTLPLFFFFFLLLKFLLMLFCSSSFSAAGLQFTLQPHSPRIEENRDASKTFSPALTKQRGSGRSLPCHSRPRGFSWGWNQAAERFDFKGWLRQRVLFTVH